MQHLKHLKKINNAFIIISIVNIKRKKNSFWNIKGFLKCIFLVTKGYIKIMEIDFLYE